MEAIGYTSGSKSREDVAGTEDAALCNVLPSLPASSYCTTVSYIASGYYLVQTSKFAVFVLQGCHRKGCGLGPRGSYLLEAGEGRRRGSTMNLSNRYGCR